MAIITADQINYSDSGDFSVGFFSLKNDGEEAIVRIMCDSMADLEIMTVHPITVGASAFPNRQVNCLRDPREPLEMCPLCAAGEKVKQKVFIRMLQYDPVTREAKPVVWDRVASIFAPKIKSFLDNYGPLSHIMCKIIRHGTGKSTLLSLLSLIKEPETGEVIVIGKKKIVMMPQEVTFDTDMKITEFLEKQNLPIYETKAILTKLEINDFDQMISTLSGGNKRKLALGIALARESDLLILDEPTNHLDSDIIEWLEKFLIKRTKAVLLVTHDRYFLERVCNKIMDLDHGKLSSYVANYSKYLELPNIFSKTLEY